MHCSLTKFIRLTTYAAIFVTLSGCGLFSKNDAGAPTAQASVCSIDDPAFRASFKSTLHTSLQQNCYECHNAQSPKAPSPFADDSPSIAMETAKRFVDFNSPSSSALVKRMEQGHNCFGKCGTLVLEFAEKIAAWKNELGGSVSKLSEDCSGLKDQDDARVVRTSVKSIDSSIPEEGKTLVFDLKDATPSIPGAAFQVRIKPFKTGTYIIDKPVLAIQPLTSNPDQNVRISNIHLLINGSENDLYRNFVSTDFVLQPRLFPQGTEVFGWYTVKEAAQIVNWSGSTEDLSFDIKISVTNALWIEPKTQPFNCKNFADFNAFYAMKKAICLDCHDSGGGGYPFFPMKPVADAEVCRNFKMRSNPADPLQSLFYLMPQDLIPNYRHPVELGFTDLEKAAIIKWVATES